MVVSSAQQKFIGFCLVLVALLVGIYLAMARQSQQSNQYYSQGFQKEWQQTRPEPANNADSKQPQAPGFREADMQKYHGNRYDTY